MALLWNRALGSPCPLLLISFLPLLTAIARRPTTPVVESLRAQFSPLRNIHISRSLGSKATSPILLHFAG